MSEALVSFVAARRVLACVFFILHNARLLQFPSLELRKPFPVLLLLLVPVLVELPPVLVVLWEFRNVRR